jgi:hypothetical protein
MSLIRCIDQKSTTERNHQVRLMSEIYAQASQVLVYLGFHHPEAISNLLGYLDRRARGIITGDPTIEKSMLLGFLQHPYFNRVWVLQEISLAKLVVLHTDHETIYWHAQTVQELVNLCKNLNHDPPGVLHWLPATQRDEHDCLDLLHRARRCMATDPRDKVFALYGFLPVCFREALPVNYAMGAEEVYSNVATYLISTTKCLDVLKHVSPYQPLDLDALPSWVPDWSTRQSLDMELPKFTVLQMEKFPMFGSGLMPTETSLNAGTRLTTAHATQNDHQTGLSSRQHDSLLFYRYPDTDYHPSTRIRVDTRRFSVIPCLRVRGYLLDKVTAHANNVALSDDGRSNSGNTPFFNSGLCDFCSESLEWTSCDGASFDKRWDHQSQELANLRRVKRDLGGEKQTFMTEQSIGIALLTPILRSWGSLRERKVQPGDTIWALEGLDVPAVLRPQRRDGNIHYVFVGQCYLHRAGLDQECPVCGSSSQPWSMEFATIDIW